jgi:hypothetical protein
VEDAAEALASSDVEAGDLVRTGDRRGQRVQRAGVRDALVWAVSVVELFELVQGVEQVATGSRSTCGPTVRGGGSGPSVS